VALKIVDELRKLPGQALQLLSDLGSDLRTAWGSGEVRKRLREKFDDLRRSLRSPPVWLIAVYLVQQAVLLFALAKGFKWI